jgi:hypothetical protein
MDHRILRKSVAFTALNLLAAAALTAVPAQAQQQQDPSQQSTGDPVADAARKAREQKKKDTTKPKKVYTDEDVSHSVSPTPPLPSGTDESANTEDGAAKNNPDAQGAKGKDASGKPSDPEESAESKWRKQFKEAYASLERAEKELDILQREDNKAQVQYYSDPQKALAEQYTRKDINEHDAKIAAKKKEIEQIKQRIADMEEALRKSGGDPGWAAP